MVSLDKSSRRSLFGSYPLPDAVVSWLTFTDERANENAHWLDSSVVVTKGIVETKGVVPGQSRPQIWLGSKRSMLMMCEYDSEGFCLGTLTNGDHPLVAALMGNERTSRFALVADKENLSFRSMVSCSYDSGYVSMTFYEGVPGRQSNVAAVSQRTAVFKKDTPHIIEKEIRAFEPCDEHKPRGGSYSHIRTPSALADGSCWERFQLMAPALFKGWRNICVEVDNSTQAGASRVPSKRKTMDMRVYSRVVRDEDELREIRRDFVNKLFERALRPTVTPADEALVFSTHGEPLALEYWSSVESSSGLDSVQKVPTTRSKQAGPHTCHQCNHDFKRIYELHRHMDNVHNGVRKFSCKVCGKAFTQSTHARVHMETVHQKVMSWCCDLCGRGFGTKHKLARHQKSVHEKERSHACSVCGASYFQSSDLRRHMKQKHDDEPTSTTVPGVE
ncbi:hypothetical protein NDN08_004936 [Rhodosorus marinus]|uniref:C2H2-type domain-containing protein n=1 Tax=Rhodosorus marinus TaxID=101924 RepID=A0AAV8UKA6_9RHOD|nr:hypothetical protein NDN08_004936 [Rhodosorus marinus]